MPPRKQAYHHGNLRNALVAAAVRLIERGRHEDFSLRGAAREVGVSANAAYRHFDDKSALLTAVAMSGFEQLSRRMQKAMSAPSGGGDETGTAIGRFKAMGRAYVEFALEHPQLFGVMFGASGAPRIAPSWKGFPKDALPPYELLGKALDELVAQGALTPAKRRGAELKAWAPVHGFARLVLDGAVNLPTDSAQTEALDSVLDTAVAGLCGSRLGTPPG